MIVAEKPLLRQMKRHGLEFDQKLTEALSVCASKPDLSPEDSGLPDSYITLALYRLNSSLTDLVEGGEQRLNLFHEYKLAPPCSPEEVRPGHRLTAVLNKAIELAPTEKTLSTGMYLRAIADLSLNEPAWDYPGFRDGTHHNTFSIETLLWMHGFSAWTSLERAPAVADLVRKLGGLGEPEDMPLLLGLSGGRIVIRPVGRLGAFAFVGETDKAIATLTHMKCALGLVTADELAELEELVNSRGVKEAAFQSFFERHPQFLRVWDHREVFPQVHLTREADGDLIPDFVLVNPDTQRATVVDLKLPRARIITRKTNRDRFSSLIAEARAQLLEYKDWFESPSNREQFKLKYGPEVFRPRLGVVIGRQTDFASAVERQKLGARESDIEVVTYDDILRHAQRRIALIETAHR